MNLEKLKSELRRDEGLRLNAYQCSTGHWTIGYGHSLAAHADSSTTISLHDAAALLDADIAEAVARAKAFVSEYVWDMLADARKRVLVNMAFNLGNKLRGFKILRGCVIASDWDGAADAMLDSLWAHQVGARAIRLAKMMEAGDETDG